MDATVVDVDEKAPIVLHPFSFQAIQADTVTKTGTATQEVHGVPDDLDEVKPVIPRSPTSPPAPPVDSTNPYTATALKNPLSSIVCRLELHVVKLESDPKIAVMLSKRGRKSSRLAMIDEGQASTESQLSAHAGPESGRLELHLDQVPSLPLSQTLTKDIGDVIEALHITPKGAASFNVEETHVVQRFCEDFMLAPSTGLATLGTNLAWHLRNVTKEDFNDLVRQKSRIEMLTWKRRVVVREVW